MENKKEKPSPRERLVKKLQTRFDNLKKKIETKTAEFQAEKKLIHEEMETLNIQLSALKKK